MTTELIQRKTLEKLTWNWQGHQIQYTQMGEGQPLLLIHGFGASIGHWKHNIPILAEQGYQVFAMDLLGFGGSDKPVKDYCLDLWLEQIKDFWQAHIQQPTIFIGNSIGGLLSLMTMVYEPEISSGGVLINCAGGLNHRPNELNLPLRFIMGSFTKLVSSPITGKFIFNQVRKKHQIRRSLYQVYSDKNAVTDELVEMLYEPSNHSGAQEVFASVLSAPAGPHPSELLPKLNLPLLVLWGEDDPWTPISGSKIYQDLASNNEDVKFYPIKNAGHCPHDEKPNEVNSLIIDWLKSLAITN